MLVGNYRLFRVIGDGAFSTVMLGHHVFTQEPVAVKIISKEKFVEPETKERWSAGIATVKSLNHPGIIKIFDVLEDDTSVYLVSEYCGGGELYDFITSRSRVEEPLAKRIFKQIVLAVRYLHSQNVIHRDLKPENVLLTEDNSIKLIDFGLSNIHADQPLHDRCGSPCYIAPEALTTEEYFGKPADVWALGVILYALVDGSLPWNYQDGRVMFRQITTGEFPMPAQISAECQNLLRGILYPDPAKRLTIEEILVHPWLFGVGNVFPLQETADAMHLTLDIGGFSASEARQPVATINEILAHEEARQPGATVKTLRGGKLAQPRSLSLEHSEEATAAPQGPIMSPTMNRRSAQAVATEFETTIAGVGMKYRKLSPLMFALDGPNLEVTAEVCRLYGFRNSYVLSFKRMQGETWSYTQFVASILALLKPA